MAKDLDPTKKDAAERLRAALNRQQERDLTIRLTWEGQAALDLKVQEPTGSVATWQNRQTVGGGILIGGTLTENHSVTYVAAQAFSGEYKINVDPVWGKPLGGKAKVEIIQHQGTPQETTRPVTVNVTDGSTLTIKLSDGRRTEAAYVPPPSANEQPEAPAEMGGTDSVLRQLRAITDPGESSNCIIGNVGGMGVATSQPPSSSGRKGDERTAYQTKVAPFVTNSADLTAQAAISGDRRYVTLSMNVSFFGATGTRSQAQVSVIPGAGFKPSGLK
jgi:hypothetical protein